MHFAVKTIFERNLQNRINFLEMILEVEVCLANLLSQQVEHYSQYHLEMMIYVCQDLLVLL